MVYIAAGAFLMGDDDQSDNPRHTVTLSDYWMYRNVVTVGMYKKYCAKTGVKMPDAPGFDPDWSKEDHPIVDVTWIDAQAYCTWAGLSLPSEAEWEKAARGTDGRKFAWGELFDIGKVWASNNLAGDLGGTTAVGKYGVSVYGCTDMGGNVWQWCADYYDDKFWSGRAALTADPVNLGVGEQTRRVLRGGAWGNDDPRGFRASRRFRNNPTNWDNFLGFRCAFRSDFP
jgi:formylglycine-generating enzyme required for sulfatase activity